MNPKETKAHAKLTLALPVAEGRLHSHFGGSAYFALVEIDPERKVILSTRSIAAPPHTPGLLPRWLRAQGVEVVIAGGIGRRALDLFAQEGIEVRAGRPGAPVEQLVASYLGGGLAGAPEGCKGHEGPHEHGAGPTHQCRRA